MKEKAASWVEELSREADRIVSLLLTENQFQESFDKLLDRPECPLEGVQFILHSEGPFSDRVLGRQASGTPDSRTFRIEDNRGSTCRILKWAKSLALDQGDLDASLQGFFEAYWKPRWRTESAGIIDLKRDANAGAVAGRTVEDALSQRKHCTIAFFDLDGFKPVNDALGHKEGDRIIREFGALLETSCAAKGVILHNGGDEFLVLVPYGDAQQALRLAYQVAQIVGTYDFKAGSFELGVSTGLATTETEPDGISFNELVSKADQALNKLAKQPKKGRARFAVTAPPLESAIGLKDRILIAHCLVKSQVSSPRPFASIWLNCLSQVTCESLTDKFSFEELKIGIDAFLGWADLDSLPNAKSRAHLARDEGFDTSPVVSALDCGFAVSHGLMRAAGFSASLSESFTGADLNLEYTETGPGCRLLQAPETIIWESGVQGDLAVKFDLGGLYRYCAEAKRAATPTARAVLVQIGHEPPPIPLAIFAERIIIDDRPTRGGGLPDFWEATIARLIAHVVKNPNIAAIYVYGNRNYAARTTAKLQDVASWRDEDTKIAYRTGMPVESIRKASALLNGKIFFTSDIGELLKDLSERLKAAYSVEIISAPSGEPRCQGILRRELEMGEWALTSKDGCRAGTIAEAYPLVLEIARRSLGAEPIRDQAGQELRELVDFKVILTNPTQELVPSFYAGEGKSLDAYFNKEFLGGDGLFGSVLQKSGQLIAVLAHVDSAIKEPTAQFATRRAILVIPHEIKPGPLAPLGLVSIRIVPRFKGDRVRLSYSYTWRTVEALVGFPYSLYGSVKYSQHLTRLIQERLMPEQARRVETGEVSYIAHSLHIFVDEYGQNIAKRIVDDASI